MEQDVYLDLVKKIRGRFFVPDLVPGFTVPLMRMGGKGRIVNGLGG